VAVSSGVTALLDHALVFERAGAGERERDGRIAAELDARALLDGLVNVRKNVLAPCGVTLSDKPLQVAS